MYDPKAEPKEFIGATRAEAVAKACSFFEAEESTLTIKEARPGQVFGLAARVAIVAIPEGHRPPSRRDRREGGPPRSGGRSEGRGRRGEGRGGRRNGRTHASAEPPVGEERDLPEAPSTAKVLGELSPVGEFVKGLIERMDLGDFEIGESSEGEHRVIQLRGPAAQRLTGSEGRTVAALQLLANQAALRQEDAPQRVIVDVEGDAEKRAAQLERVALRAAERAKETGRGVALEPMNARDRRLVHVALREVEDVATMSVGEGRYRQVVVVPAGAPEYEDAQRYASSVSDDEES